MAALAASTTRKVRALQNKEMEHYVVGTSAKIYKGALVCINTSTGRAVAATDAASRKILGVAEEQATGNTAGTVKVKVAWGFQVLLDSHSALTSAYVGANCCVGNDNLVESGTTATNDVKVGEVISFQSGDAWVAIRRFALTQV